MLLNNNYPHTHQRLGKLVIPITLIHDYTRHRMHLFYPLLITCIVSLPVVRACDNPGITVNTQSPASATRQQSFRLPAGEEYPLMIQPCPECKDLVYSCKLIDTQTKAVLQQPLSTKQSIQISELRLQRNHLLAHIFSHVSQGHAIALKNHCTFCNVMLIGDCDDSPQKLAYYHIAINPECRKHFLLNFSISGLTALNRFCHDPQ